MVTVARILINALLVLSLILGVSFDSIDVRHQQNEQSADPESPLEREEATTRSHAARAAGKRAGHLRLSKAEALSMSPVSSTRVDSRQIRPPIFPQITQKNLQQLLGVFRI